MGEKFPDEFVKKAAASKTKNKKSKVVYEPTRRSLRVPNVVNYKEQKLGPPKCATKYSVNKIAEKKDGKAYDLEPKRRILFNCPIFN